MDDRDKSRPAGAVVIQILPFIYLRMYLNYMLIILNFNMVII